MAFSYKLKCLAGVALWAMPTSLIAQTTQTEDPAERLETAAAQADAVPEVDVITVTGSRIRGNFQAPTPVQAIGTELIEQRGTTNIANVINELPAFTGTLTPTSTNLSSSLNGVNVLDLRGLGPNRNLVLINGRRGTPFNENGYVDLNSLPSLAVARVEVVTGGASAAYGSDAISGVVNLIFDETLQGLKLNAQYGISDEGDAENLRLSGAWGSNFGTDGRGHILIAADYDDNKGILRGDARAWQRRRPGLVGNPLDTGPDDGIPAFVIRDDTKLFLGTPNGVTLPLGFATDNLEFFPDGTVAPRVLGENIGGTNLMVGGSGATPIDRANLLIPTERYNVLVAAHYDVAEAITVFGEASYARSKSRGALVDALTFGDVVITPDNPYLPASVAALGEPFVLFRTFEEFDPITSVSDHRTYRFVGGLKGTLGKGWHWEVSGQHGQSDFGNDQENNLLVGNLVKAADAVRVGSDIVCRVNADANPANNDPSCVPINLFGKGSPSAAAIDYITATGVTDTRIRQTVFAAELSGELFGGWAGPILATVGAEHRRESLHRTVNAPNANEEFLIVNSQPLDGRFDVSEGFAEVAVPLLDGTMKADLNGAARYTHYSTVGDVVTWKVGMTFEPVSILRLRGTISRDIRAPSIGESFVKSVLDFRNISNPFIPGSPSNLTRTPITGNPDLTEEKATTKTVGAVLSLGHLRASLDWYNINLQGAIGRLAPQEIVNLCYAGNDALCDAITFNDDQTIYEVRSQNLNLGAYKVQGLDFEARYSTPLANGDLQLGALASYLIHKKIAPSGGMPIDRAGEVGGVSGFGMPEFKATVSAGYDARAWGVFVQARYIGGGVYDACPRDATNSNGCVYSPPEGLSEADNKVGAVVYLDMSAKYKLENVFGGSAELYAGIDNLLDRDPPIIPLDLISNSATNAAIYDVIGRKFYVGIRTKF